MYKNTTQNLKDFFVSKLLRNAISLPFNLFLLNFPHHTQANQKSNPQPWEGLSNSPLPGNRKYSNARGFAQGGGRGRRC